VAHEKANDPTFAFTNPSQAIKKIPEMLAKLSINPDNALFTNGSPAK